MKRIIIIALLLITFFSSKSQQVQERKKLPAVFTTASIKIDGNLDEEAWKNAPIATGFVELRPTPGRPEDNRTEIRILYDNKAIYVAGYLHEKSVDSISRELVGRDRIGNSDFCGVIFDTYFDKINAVGFYVTPYGEQFDAKYSSTSGEDENWNAVWSSEAKMQNDGWTFEMEIPYSALRFTTKENQTWGLNITRRRTKTNQQFFWNTVDPKINGFVNQEGEWTGIGKIKSPVRLSLTPYLSAYLNHYPANTPGIKNTTTSINGGMDIKYGITPSFTLDMTLVPDFGQVQSDNQVLNLSPFEVKYNENRSFFTEGTELFNKGNLFYSRRIGGSPLNQYKVYADLKHKETVIRNPSETKLLNATKISGRTKGGLGIGIFNAITNPMYADIEDSTGHRRKFETNPLTNYNIMVFDQTLKNNSSVSLINTNVLRSGTDYDANVTAALFEINNKKNTYNVYGKVSVSKLFNVNSKNIDGYSHSFGVGKSGGRFNFNLSQELTDDKYDISDMGYFTTNNYLDHYLWIGYRWLKPTKWYNNIYLNTNLRYSRRLEPSVYQSSGFNFNVNGSLKNLWHVGVYMGYNAKGNDFYEPRVPGRFYKTPQSYSINFWMSTNEAKKFSMNANYFASYKNLFYGRNFEYSLGTNYRFSDKFSIGQYLSLSPSRNGVGFAGFSNANEILFDRRHRHTVENNVDFKYNFNKRSGITARVRHYWSEKDSQEYYILNGDGTVTLTSKVPVSGSGNPVNTDQNFNAFNIDAVYTWEFAPGSFLNVVYKNATFAFDKLVNESYFRNVDKTLSSPQANNISFKLIYYLDYLKFRKKSKLD